MADDNSTYKTAPFLACFVNLVTPKANDNGERYELLAVFKNEKDVAPLRAMAEAAIEKKFGAQAKHVAKRPGFKNPIRSGDDIRDKKGKLYAGIEEGDICVTFHTKTRPGVVDRQLNDLFDETEIYSGMIARATVDCYAYDNKSQGFSFGLHNVQKLKDGERLAGARNAASEDFEALPDDDGDDLFND